jgi:WXG100 family type VII secretion target
MANVIVDYQGMRRAAKQLASGKEDIEGQLQRLKSLVDALVGSEFVTDRASGKFQESYRQWNSGAKNVMQGLEGMSKFLETAIRQHEDLDTKLGQQSGG